MLYRLISPALEPVSRLSLGSWNTFSRCSPDELSALLGRAFEQGVNLLDVGYYWDKPDTEEAVAAALRLLGRDRNAFMIAQKLWLWDYPAESFSQQLDRSLRKLRHDYVDIVLVSRPTPDLEMAAFCEEVVALIKAGKARTWGVTNFTPDQAREALRLADFHDWPVPVMLQMQYNVTRRGVVEGPGYRELFQEGRILLCAAHMLEGGILAGHLDRDRVDPPAMAAGQRPVHRNIARDSGGIREEIRLRQPSLKSVAAEFGATAAQAALAFVLSHAALATGLVGVTTVHDLDENIGALTLLDRIKDLRTALDSLQIAGVAHPKLFNPHNDI